jgi:hypothetical protein
MLNVQVVAGGAVVNVMSLAKFMGADQMPSAMYAEAAINKFNDQQVQAGIDQVAQLVRVLH